ncbi:amidohydrolase family protein [Paenibacillus validus]|uniref:Amidohydrolase family protein n=1 Tax=Paenibacillus validus TaxID=44253 RepID=A0A7X2Z9Z0_9BACL|nr:MULTISPECIES: amidohydrolase family protein [Paenibacillus]MED4600432.1 amidohydrolase family protein [Paenibacillus validus]MED4605338.1 amidohydrolase family protein [Paenibacillus validus]MUG70358.1 amidohydrolase family protein [Paenibacillus validus]
MRSRGIRFDTNEAVEVEISNGLIVSVRSIAEEEGLPWISPGWIDLQVNGYNGFDFNGEITTVQDVAGVTESLYEKGVTRYLPTVITGSFERIKQAMTAISEACEQYPNVNKSVIGIHLEGPYVSGEDGPRGAHDKTFVRDPDWHEFAQWQEASGNRIRLVTVAPEREGAIPFIEKLKAAGIAVSIGHTCASLEQLEQAVAAGAALSTHLGNGAHPVLPRHPHYIWNQLAEDRLCATFIADGHHLSKAVLKAMLRAKRDQFILVSDCVKFGGMKPGRYSSVIGAEVELHADGKLTPVDQPLILAGSAQALDVGIAGAIQLAGITLNEAIQAVTLRPARVLGFPGGDWLRPGSAANFTLFTGPDERGSLEIRETIVGGETQYLKP